MADFNSVYTLVKKQDEKIDGLLKTSKSNQELLMGIDTRLTAAPADTATSATLEEIQAMLPKDIATNDSVRQFVDTALKQQKIDALKSLDFSRFPKQLAEVFAKFFKDGLDESVKKTLHEGISDAFNSQTREFREAGKQLNNRMYSVINGAVWAAIPKWFYAVVGVIFLSAIGLGILCYNLYQDNRRLHKVEWMYRYERGLNRDLNVVMHRERQMLHGTTHEVDSLKRLIRGQERQANADTTFIYYYPSDL